MRVLITNPFLVQRSGTETYVVDLACELQRRGHLPVIYVKKAGPLAGELRDRDIPVITRLAQLPFVPDIIHGHGHEVTLKALAECSNVPGLFICHNHRHWIDTTPIHPRILRYFGVSELCVARLLNEGAPVTRTETLLNWVDTKRFLQRDPLPKVPKRALIFSNYASDETHLPAVRLACSRANLTLDVIGLGVGKPAANPEVVLTQYDLVFAKAKAAMEAMAVGAAVVLCDFAGVGPMVTPENFEYLQKLNFGFQALDQPLCAESLLPQIAAYDVYRAGQVTRKIRQTASLEQRVDQLIDIYTGILADFQAGDANPAPVDTGYRLRQVRSIAKQKTVDLWFALPMSLRRRIKSNRHLQRLIKANFPG